MLEVAFTQECKFYQNLVNVNASSIRDSTNKMSVISTRWYFQQWSKFAVVYGISYSNDSTNLTDDIHRTVTNKDD